MVVAGSTHSAPQFSGALAGHPFVHWKPGPMGAQNGAAAAHTELHAPQLVASERSFSQPSAGDALQSAWPGSQAAMTHCRPWHAIVLCVPTHAVQLGLPQP